MKGERGVKARAAHPRGLVAISGALAFIGGESEHQKGFRSDMVLLMLQG